MRTRPRQRLLAATLAAIFGPVLATTGASPAAAQGTEQLVSTEAFDIRIPAQPLATALNELSRQTGAQIIAGAALLTNTTSRDISGRLTVEQALGRMLADARLEAIRTANGGFAIQRASEKGGAALPTVLVTASGGGESATGPVAGYVAKRSGTGTKTDTPIVETPQSISVVTSEQMRAQHAQTLQDALGYTSGIAAGAAAINPSVGDTFFIRGFQADTQFGSFYRDGMRYMANIYNGKQEPYGIERVELLKGPSSILYGAAAPGGVINSVTKRPQTEPYHEVSAEIGNDNRRQLSADLTGPLDAEGVWSYRLTALARKSDTFIDYGRNDRVYVAPALTWRPSAATSLTLLASHQESKQSDAGTLPANGTLLPNPNGVIPRSRYLGEPGHNRFNTTTSTIGYVFEHSLADGVKLNHRLRKFDSKLDAQYFLLSGWTDGATRRQIGRQSRAQNDDTSVLTSDTNVQFDIGTGPVKHTLLAGIDYTKSDHQSERQRGTLAAINVFAPVYGTGFTTSPWRLIEDNRRQVGIYVQDQIKIDNKWVALIGGRYDSFRNEDILNTSRTYSKDSAFTGRAGVVYLADNGLAPYASFSQSFNPTGGTDRLGRTFDPDKGEQYEVGVRYQPSGSDTMLSAAVYQLTRKNVLTPDPVDATFSVQTGEVRSRGLELEAKTKVGRHLSLIAAYTYNDARTTHSNNPAEIGARFFAAPFHVASIWADYNLGAWGLPGWIVGGGARYVSSKPGSTASASLGVPGYTLFDAQLSYDNGPWRYTVNVANLSDKRYIPSVCYTGVTGCDYGAPRTITAGATYRW